MGIRSDNICFREPHTIGRVPLILHRNEHFAPGKLKQFVSLHLCLLFVAHSEITIVADENSKWPEVIKMSSSTSTSETIKLLLSLFSRHGLPDKLVSDNGPQFTSDEFKKFMSNCGILHIKTAPYHPQTNGEAERISSRELIMTKT